MSAHRTASATRTTTVPKELVHKLRESEVLLTGVGAATAPDRSLVTAQWGRDHCFYALRHGFHDPLLVVETIRQTSLLLAHTAFAVPLGHHLVWEDFRYALAVQALRADPLDPEVCLEVRCDELIRHGSRVATLAFDYNVRRGDEPVATAQTRFTVQRHDIYRRLRKGRSDAATAMAAALPPTPPVPAGAVGRSLDRDVVLSATEARDRWRLRVDTAHPYLFDHPVDHIPGALLLDAARQAAQAFAQPAVALAGAMECEFFSYIELDRPCWVEARQLPRDPARRPRVAVAFQQGGATACSVVVTLSPLAG